MERLSALYASALFDLALERGTADMFLDQASFVRDSLRDPQCRSMLVHPQIPASEKQEFFRKVFAKHINDDLLGFLFLVTEKNRETYLVPALDSLIGMISRHKGKVTANVCFASALSEKQLAAIKNVLSKMLDKDVEISLNVDKTIIGGPYILVDGYYLDWTVRTRLRDLMVHMKEGCGA